MQVSLSKTSSPSSFSSLLFVLVGVCGSNILFPLCPIPRPGYCCHSVPVIPPSYFSSSTVLFQVFLCLPTVLAPSGPHPNSTIQSLDLSPGRSKSNAKDADLILPHPLCYELAGGAVPIACTLCICSSSLPFWCTFSWCYLVTLLATGHPVGFCQAAS